MSDAGDQKKVIARIKRDFEFYCKHALHIKTKDARIIPLTFNRAQRRLWHMLLEQLVAGKPIRWIVLKARQLGISTFIEAFVYWLISTNCNRGAVVVAHTTDSAETLFGMQKLFYKTMPAELRPMRKISNRKELHFANPDDEGELGLESRVLVQTAENSEIGRSFTIQLAHLSEFAFWEQYGYDQKTRMVSLNQAIPELPGTAVFIETTACGEGYFKGMWDDEESPYTKIFISWIADDNYRIEIDESQYFELSETEDSIYGNEYEESEYIKAQIRFWYPEWDNNEPESLIAIDHEMMCRLMWRRMVIRAKCEKDKAKFRQEYPTIPEQAFVATGSSVFDSASLIEMKKRIKEKKIEGMRFRYNDQIEDILSVVGTGKKFNQAVAEQAFYQANSGPLVVFEPPLPGRRYVLGADVAEGIEGGDFSSAVILRCPEMVEVATFNQIVDPAEFSYILFSLATIYNKALLGVEVNEAGGYAVVNKLQRELFYGNLYWREVFDDSRNVVIQKKYGWKTTTITKPIMVTDLRQAVRDFDVVLNNEETINQCLVYKRFENGKLGAAPPAHDDISVALMIGVQMAKQIHISTKVENQKVKKYSVEWWARLADKASRANGRLGNRNFGQI